MRRKSTRTLADFAETVPADEIERHLCGPIWNRMKRFEWRNKVHIHHVFHAGTRYDLWWNLVRASEAAHAYCHKEPVGGMLACMWAIIVRANGCDVPLADVAAEWRRAFGRDAVGWVLAKRDAGEIPDYYLPTAAAILECFL